MADASQRQLHAHYLPMALPSLPALPLHESEPVVAPSERRSYAVVLRCAQEGRVARSPRLPIGSGGLFAPTVRQRKRAAAILRTQFIGWIWLFGK